MDSAFFMQQQKQNVVVQSHHDHLKKLKRGLLTINVLRLWCDVVHTRVYTRTILITLMRPIVQVCPKL